MNFLENLKPSAHSLPDTPQGCAGSLDFLPLRLHLLCLSLSTSGQSQAPTWVLEYTEPEISGTPVLLEVTDTPEGEETDRISSASCLTPLPGRR